MNIDITDTSGNKLQHYVYSDFGVLLGIENPPGTTIDTSSPNFTGFHFLPPPVNTSLAFAGREYDSESGLYYLRARYYDPDTGRFLQTDPNAGSLSIPVSVTNAYTYCANNPVNIFDPSGTSFITDALTDLGLAAGFVALTVASGGTDLLSDALEAVGSAALGSATAAAAYATGSSIISGNWSGWGGNFWSSFNTDFDVSVGFLTMSVVAADLLGGGVVAAGGNGLNGWVESKTPILGGGGLTIGSATLLSGVAPSDAAQYGSFAAHEFGHTLQFIGLSAAAGALNSQATAWGAYGGLGVLGAVAPGGAGAWWEQNATALGGL